MRCATSLNPTTGIAHHRVEEAGPLTAVALADLIAFGAVYVDGRRTMADVGLAPGQIVRVHTRPKRYHWASEPRVLRETDELVVIDKPSGMPTHATLDNAHENAARVMSERLSRPLMVTHRLDIPTAGVLVLAKSSDEQALVNKVFARGRVTKIYAATAAARVPDGEHRHFIDPETKVPRAITTDARPGWWECRLIVEGATAGENRWIHRVRLLTGKTHQIRAQFAALGAPLDGDALYGGRPADAFGLFCERLTFPFREETIDVDRGRDNAAQK